jgi:hypothetical protein
VLYSGRGKATSLSPNSGQKTNTDEYKISEQKGFTSTKMRNPYPILPSGATGAGREDVAKEEESLLSKFGRV